MPVELKTAAAKAAQEELLTGSNGVAKHLAAFKEAHKDWEKSPNTKNLINALEVLQAEFEKFLQAMDDRIYECEKNPDPRILGVPVGESAARLAPITPLLQSLEKIQGILAQLIYSNEIAQQIETHIPKDSSNRASYDAAREMIDNFITPLLVNNTIPDAVRALSLKPDTLKKLQSTKTSGTMRATVGQIFGSGDALDQCLTLLDRCHIGEMQRSEHIVSLFMVMLQQVITPEAKSNLVAIQCEQKLLDLDERKTVTLEKIDKLALAISATQEKISQLTDGLHIIQGAEQYEQEEKIKKLIRHDKALKHQQEKLRKQIPEIEKQIIEVMESIPKLKEQIKKSTAENKPMFIREEHEKYIKEMTLKPAVIITPEASKKEKINAEVVNKAPGEKASTTDVSTENKIETLCTLLKSLDSEFTFIKNFHDAEKHDFIDSYKTKLTDLAGEKHEHLNDYWQAVQKILRSMPSYMRNHLQRHIAAEAKAQRITAPKWLNSQRLASASDENKSPLIIHLTGSGVGPTNEKDPLGTVIAEYKNYMIRQSTGSELQEIMYAPGLRENIHKILAALQLMPIQPKNIVLTGFSRGAAAQIELANLIHNAFNSGRDPRDWITIDMFLVDPVYGMKDDENSATTTSHIPPCVNTVNILSASKPSAELEHVSSQRKPHEIIADPSFTRIRTLKLTGEHNDLGKPEPTAELKGMRYFVSEIFRAFLNDAGCEPANGRQEETPQFNKEYIKNTLVAEQQELAATYTASDAARLQNSTAEENKSLQFSNLLTDFARPLPEKDSTTLFGKDKEKIHYHEALEKINAGILQGHYKTFPLTGHADEKRSYSNMPHHMSEMQKMLTAYFATEDKEKDPKATFKTIQALAKTAAALWKPSRKATVQHFYEDIAKTAEPDFTKVSKLMTETDFNIRIFLEQQKRKLVKIKSSAVDERNAQDQASYTGSLARQWIPGAYADQWQGTAQNTKTIDTCNHILNNIAELLKDDLSQGESEHRLTDLKNFIRYNQGGLDQSLSTTMIDDISKIQGEIETARLNKFTKMTQDILSLVENYAKYDNNARVGPFKLDPLNLAMPKELKGFVDFLNEGTLSAAYPGDARTLSSAEKFTLLTRYLDRELIAAKARHESRWSHKISTWHLGGYQTFMQTNSRLVEVLTQAKDTLTALNQKNNNPIPAAPLDEKKFAAIEETYFGSAKFTAAKTPTPR